MLARHANAKVTLTVYAGLTRGEGREQSPSKLTEAGFGSLTARGRKSVGTVGTLDVRSGSLVREQHDRKRSICRDNRTGANGREHLPRLDKLGVTGSSPVPPIGEAPETGPFRFPNREHDPVGVRGIVRTRGASDPPPRRESLSLAASRYRPWPGRLVNNSWRSPCRSTRIGRPYFGSAPLLDDRDDTHSVGNAVGQDGHSSLGSSGRQQPMIPPIRSGG